MIIRDLQKDRIRIVILIAIISLTGGALFTSILEGFKLQSVLRGGAIGFFIGGILTAFELFMSQKLSQTFKLIVTILIKSLIYSTVIIGILTLNAFTNYRSGQYDYPDFLSIIIHPSFLISIYFSIAMTIVIISLLSINDLIGRGILLKFILGSYHKPREEKKIFMFLDLKNSTQIAETLGHEKFMYLIKDFFYDLSSPILSTKGEIYKYVGDEAIISWDFSKGIKDSNALKTFFLFKDIIYNKKDYYLKKYGLIPDFKAGIHGGNVVTGEIGTFKKEITYLGDVLNTAARIEGQCNTLKEDLLISSKLFSNFQLGEQYKIKEFQNISLRGKKDNIRLFSVKAATP